MKVCDSCTADGLQGCRHGARRTVILPSARGLVTGRERIIVHAASRDGAAWADGHRQIETLVPSARRYLKGNLGAEVRSGAGMTDGPYRLVVVGAPTFWG